MQNLSMCRICLATDVRLCSVTRRLQDMYEKLTELTFKREDRRPLAACYICLARLQNCYWLRMSCLRSDKQITKMMSSGVLVPQDMSSTNTLRVVSVLHLSLGHVLRNRMECHIKEEAPEVIHDTELDQQNTEDIAMELQEEHDTQMDEDMLCLHLEGPLNDHLMKREPDNFATDIPVFKKLKNTDSQLVTDPEDYIFKKNNADDVEVHSSHVSSPALVQNEVEVPVAGPSKPPSMAIEIKKMKKMRAYKKKCIANLTPEQRAQHLQLQSEKQVGQFLMPDAPPSKKRKTGSPDRVPCPLKPGTPSVPPPRIPQAWELDKIVPVTYNQLATPSPKTGKPLIFTTSKGIVSMPPDNVLNEGLVVDAKIGFSSIPPSTAVRSPVQATPSPGRGSSIFEDNMEAEWERNAGLCPGSDVEDDDDDDDGNLDRLRRHAAECSVDELTSELQTVLHDNDRRDDQALRDLVDTNMLTFNWSRDNTVFCGEREVFTGPSGPTFSTDGMSPFQLFSKIWDEDFVSVIVTETNRYGAKLCNDADVSQYATIRRWVPITAQDLWNFIAILMLMSLAPLPVESEYWKPCLPHLKIGNFPDIMPFYRFKLIKRCLHFVNNELAVRGIPDKLAKIKPIIDHLNNKFSTLYLPGQEIAIDESLLLWKGRLSFSQHIANKAAQVGIKSYELCESKTGYLWKFIIYTGKNEGHNVDIRLDSEPEGATSQIVYSLVRPLLHKGHTLVMDNFYNSPLLARSLKAKKTDVMGTLRLHREFVPERLKVKNRANMREKEVAFSNTHDLTITVWRDTNVVSLISTYHHVEVGGKEKYGYYRYRPTVVLDYNLFMGGVDKKDQLLQAFPIERCRNTMWYKKLFRRLLNVSILNTCIIAKNMPQRQFRVRLVDEILKIFSPPKIQPAPSSGGHFPARNDMKRARCKWCAAKKVDTSTVWKCDTCNVNLCILGCFKDYHLSNKK